MTLLSGNVFSQSITDTIFHIPDVLVSAPRSAHFRQDIRIDEFSKEEIKNYTGQSLFRFLSDYTALNIKAYGVGGASSSISLRGASSSQVQVNWNGFPINSVTLGSCDISMIPAAGFDRVSVVYGASGALYGSGTFGGAVNLDNEMHTGKVFSGGAYLGYQSLKTINSGLLLNAGNDKIAWKISAWGTVSENEFNYYDYIRQSKREQTDGNWSDYGLIQNLVMKLSPSSSIEAGMWYQVKLFDIPSRIGSTTYEHQSDSTLKFYLGYKYLRNRWSLKIKAARFCDKENYWQKASAQSTEYSIESRIASRQYYSDINFRYFLSSRFSVDAGLTGSLIKADVSAYGGEKEETGLAAFTGLKYSYHRLTLQTTMRKEWNNTFSSQMLPSFGLSWEPFPDKWKLRANYSQKFRKPTFNDLFWMPGGNSNLNPETGFTIETGSEILLFGKNNVKISVDEGIYYSHIKDMIVWRPDGAYWVAKNYQNVNSEGIELVLKFDLKQQRWRANSSVKMTLNRSTYKAENNISNETMLYSPLVIASWENKVESGLFDFKLRYHFTSGRYYAEDRRLDQYYLIDAAAGANIPVGNGKLGIHVEADNITNTTYELVRLYPMPGRYWTIKLDYTF